jgi:hypothetical protein
MTNTMRGLTRMTIEFDPASAPIAGWLEREGQPRREFRGMIELISLIETPREHPVDRAEPASIPPEER